MAAPIKLMSENERWLLVAAFKNIKGKFEVNWDAVAAEPDCPYKNKSSITVTFSRMKREKLGWGGSANCNTGTPNSRKKTVGSGTNTTPSKVTKCGGGRKKKSSLSLPSTPSRRNLTAESENAEELPAKTTRGHKVEYEYETPDDDDDDSYEPMSPGGGPDPPKTEPNSPKTEAESPRTGSDIDPVDFGVGFD